jgi:OOP family OmpA-OmpF porin
MGTIFSQHSPERLDALAKQLQFKNTRSIEFTEASFKVLDTLAILLKHTKVSYRFTSYSGMRGKSSDNLIKTQKRAKIITQELLKRGVDSTQFVAIGLGETNPIASMPRTRGKSKNERVEIEIMEE